MKSFSFGQKQPPEVFSKKRVFKNFAIFTGLVTLRKERKVFSCGHCEIFKNTYFEENLRTSTSAFNLLMNHCCYEFLTIYL